VLEAQLLAKGAELEVVKTARPVCVGVLEELLDPSQRDVGVDALALNLCQAHGTSEGGVRKGRGCGR